MKIELPTEKQTLLFVGDVEVENGSLLREDDPSPQLEPDLFVQVVDAGAVESPEGCEEEAELVGRWDLLRNQKSVEESADGHHKGNV